jgi:hypothetical protein
VATGSRINRANLTVSAWRSIAQPALPALPRRQQQEWAQHPGMAAHRNVKPGLLLEGDGSPVFNFS